MSMQPPSRRHFLSLMGTAAAGAALVPVRSLGAFDPAGDEAMLRVLRRIREPEFPAREFRVTDFGARPGFGNDSLPAFNAAVHHCNTVGGGRVIVPDGEWELAGPWLLKSNVHVHLADRAHVRFRTDEPERYLPVVLTRWEGTEVFNYSPLMYAYQAHNVAITGGGLIDGNSAETFVKWRPKQRADQRALREMGGNGVPVVQRVFGAGHWLRPPFLQFFSCTNILVDGPRFIDAPFWVIHAVASSNITIRRVRVDSPHLNSDGFDPESCTDVLVEDCVFNTGDDCISLKSGRDNDAWRIGQPTENVVIRRIDMNAPTAGSGLAIGSELSAGIRNVWVESLRMGNAQTAVNIKANLDRGGGAENIFIRDVSVGETDALIKVTTNYHGYRGGNHPPTFRGLHLASIRCTHAKSAISIAGVEAARVEDMELRNVDVAAADQPPVVRHVRGLAMENVRINGSPFHAGPDAD